MAWERLITVIHTLVCREVKVVAVVGLMVLVVVEIQEKEPWERLDFLLLELDAV